MPPQYFLISGPARVTWEYKPETGEAAWLAPQDYEDDIPSPVDKLAGFDRLPQEIVDKILDRLVVQCIRSRNFGLACDYACLSKRTLAHWTRLLVGPQTRLATVCQRAKDLGGWFMMLTTLDEVYDAVWGPSRRGCVPVFEVDARVCQALCEGYGLGPEQMVEHTILQGDGMDVEIERRCHIEVAAYHPSNVVIGDFKQTDDYGWCGTHSWRGHRVCDALLHDGLMCDTTGIVRSELTIGPFILMRLRTRDFCKCPHGQGADWPSKYWVFAIKRWEWFESCVAIAFHGAQLFVHTVDAESIAPWLVKSVGAFLRPSQLARALHKNALSKRLTHYDDM